jgi:hypothetical protein
MRGFSAILAAIAGAAVVLPQPALACQPATPPPLPPPNYGETPEEYDARLKTEARLRSERLEAEARAARLERETSLWASSERIFLVEVLEAPRIVKERPTHRRMEIILRTLASARGDKAPERLKLRYDRQFSICGYYGSDYFTSAKAGDLMALFAAGGKLSGATINDAISATTATHPETLGLLEQARRAP